MLFKTVQQKIMAAVLLLFSISLSISIITVLFFKSLLLIITVLIITMIIMILVFFIVLRHSVINKIYMLKEEIDLSVSDEAKKGVSLNTGDEFEELANRMNRMIQTIQDKSIGDQNKLIDEITSSENEKYLQNVHDGLLFIDYGQIISEYYSQSLIDIFDREEVGGQHLSDFLYPDRIEYKTRRKTLEKFIISFFNDTDLYQSINDENNPLHNIWISRNDGRRILVDGSYRKIEENGTLVQIMIIFKDRTNEGILEKKLNEKDMRSNFELDSIVSILRSGSGPYLQYIEKSEELISTFREDLQDIHSNEVIQRSFRAINSMKCSAVYFDFKAVEKLCHNLEDILSDFREGHFSRKEALDIIIDDIYIQFDHIKHLISRFQEFLLTKEGQIYETRKNEQEHFFDSLKIMMDRNADYLEKKIEFTFLSDFTEFPLIDEIQNSVIHLLRNAVDHGIELPHMRLQAGKSENGKIRLSILKMEDLGAKIIIEDDGCGLDYEKLREIAIEKGFIKKEEQPSQGNLIRALFSSGFSIRSEINGLSGRGVGLDAVKEDIRRIGGRISIKTDHMKGSRFSILLPSELF